MAARSSASDGTVPYSPVSYVSNPAAASFTDILEHGHTLTPPSLPAGNVAHCLPCSSVDLLHLPRRVWRGNSKWCEASRHGWTKLEAASLRRVVNGGGNGTRLR